MRITFCILIVIACSSLAGEPASPRGLLDDAWGAVPRNETLSAFKARRQGAKCTPHRADSADAQGQYCVRCVEQLPVGEAQWDFYAFAPDQKELELGSVQIVSSGPADTLDASHRALVQAVTSRFSAGTPVIGCAKHDFACAFFKDSLERQTGDTRTLVTKIVPTKDYADSPPQTALFLSSHRFTQLRNQAMTAMYVAGEQFNPPGYDFGSTDADLDAVSSEVPELENELDSMDEIRPVVKKLLAAAGRAKNAERRGLLMLVANGLAVRMYENAPEGKPGEVRTENLAGHKLRYTWRQKERPGEIDAWTYDLSLLNELYRKQPETRAGGRAFLALIHDGFDETGRCKGDRYREVIEQVDAFLKKYPKHALRRELMAEQAVALETWWSLSLSDPKLKRDEGEAARTRAISLWRELLTGKDILAEAAQRHLPRMELGCDTGERVYVCPPEGR